MCSSIFYTTRIMETILSNAFAAVLFDPVGDRLVVRVLDGSAGRDDFDALKRFMIETYDRLDASGKTVTLVFDLSKASAVSPGYVAEWADLYRSRREVTGRIVERSRIIVKNPVIRTALSAFLLLYKTQRPVEIVDE